jgi:ribonuclease P protein component
MITASANGIRPRAERQCLSAVVQKGVNAWHQVYPESTDNFPFGRDFRLKSDLIIRETMRTGWKFSGRFLNIRCIRKDDNLRQFCIKTPKSIGNAVCRNRTKRIVREILRKSMDRFEPGIRLVIFVKSVPADDAQSHFSADLMRFLENA